MIVKILQGEYWWGAVVNEGNRMPLDENVETVIDMFDMSCVLDQSAPAFFSSKGRVLWSCEPFAAHFWHGEIRIHKAFDVKLETLGCDLRSAYHAYANRHFDTSGSVPESLFFLSPQYNTWMELGFEQTQEKILAYATAVVENGMSPGILMIDDGWQKTCGEWEFDENKIPEPAKMIEQLHALGFRVMLWTVPVVEPTAKDYDFLADQQCLLRGADGKIALRFWWEGKSPVLDLTNPKAVAWYTSQLDSLADKYGIDGFKLDAGDFYFYDEGDMLHSPCSSHEQTRLFNHLGKRYSFHEFRAGYNPCGAPYLFRLQDKRHEWGANGLQSLISHSVLQGLLGCFYHCPDMVGGGSIGDAHSQFDEELYVRWAQASALCPMMQFSLAPWRILSKEKFNIVKQAGQLHRQFGQYIVSLAQQAATTHEPILRHMAYEFPNCNYETVADQFMLGSRIMVAPILHKNCYKRRVILPEGEWKLFGKDKYIGRKTLEFDAPLDTLLYFEKVNKGEEDE